MDFLDDIRESVVDNKRVLAVKSMYRRKVKGAIMGGSKTGSIVYVEPEALSYEIFMFLKVFCGSTRQTYSV